MHSQHESLDAGQREEIRRHGSEAAQVGHRPGGLEEEIKNLETTLVEYFQSMDEVFAARDIVAKDATVKDLKEFEDMAKAFEIKLRRIDALRTTIAEKIQNALTLDEAWE